MAGKHLPKPLLAMYRHFIPIVLAVLAIATMSTSLSTGYAYPTEGTVTGWLLSFVGLTPLIYHAVRAPCCGRIGLRAAGVALRAPLSAIGLLRKPLASRPTGEAGARAGAAGLPKERLGPRLGVESGAEPPEI